MRFFLISIFIIFTFNGCEINKPSSPSINKIFSYNNFNYSKEEIKFFETEYIKILNIDNPNVLEEYLSFYDKNYSYFLNGKQKVKNLKEKIRLLRKQNKETITKKYKIHDNPLTLNKELAKKGNIKARRALVRAYKTEHPELSLKILQKLVKDEDIKSMKDYARANMYKIRPVQKKDVKKAIEIYKKLASFGELSSIMKLGNFYEYGYHKEIIPLDTNKSLEYYNKAASKGYILAKKKLYKIYSCKACKPNRYDEAKANVLQRELITDLNLRLSEVSEKETKNIFVKNKTISDKTIKELLKSIEKQNIKKEKVQVQKINKNEEVKTTEEVKKVIKKVIKKSKNYKKITPIKCYHMDVVKTELSKNCKEKIVKTINKFQNIKRIYLIPVIDKNDKKYFQNKNTKKSSINLLLKKLSNQRLETTIEYFKSKIQDESIIHKSPYHVISKVSNKGIIIKFQ